MVQFAKVYPQGVAYHLPDFFCQFQLGVACNSVAYKESVLLNGNNFNTT